LPDNTNLLEYMSRVLHELKTPHQPNNNSKHTKLYNNISVAEKHAINNLRKNDQIIVKPADKGGAVVIWPREDYIAEANKQLNDKRNYKLVKTDPFPQLIIKLNTNVQGFLADKLIDYTTFKFLFIDKPIRKPSLYLLPKVHKPDVPGRPIISGCEGPTVRLSEYVDIYLKPLIQYIQSNVKDSTDFLKRIFKLNDTLPKDFILITIDVKSLYTNIPNREGIYASTNHLNKYDTTGVNIQMIQKMLELILDNNYFEFDNEYYLQIHGTAMGTTMAVSYANIFMAALEENILKNAPEGLTPIEWIRFLDDIFAIWCHGEASLLKFLHHINEIHPTIKFEYEYSTKTVHFLDTRIYVNKQNKLDSDVYIKPTDKTMLLHNTSFHPNTCKQGIIYSQALRYRRIITDDTILLNQLRKLKIILLTRGYNTNTIDNAFNKATQYTQKQLLYSDKPDRTKTRPIFNIPFNTNTTHIGQILKKHWHLIESDPTLKILWPDVPMVAYKRNKNIKELLVNSRLKKTGNESSE
jgi:hypothetical protein